MTHIHTHTLARYSHHSLTRIADGLHEARVAVLFLMLFEHFQSDESQIAVDAFVGLVLPMHEQMPFKALSVEENRLAIEANVRPFVEAPISISRPADAQLGLKRYKEWVREDRRRRWGKSRQQNDDPASAIVIDRHRRESQNRNAKPSYTSRHTILQTKLTRKTSRQISYSTKLNATDARNFLTWFVME